MASNDARKKETREDRGGWKIMEAKRSKRE